MHTSQMAGWCQIWKSCAIIDDFIGVVLVYHRVLSSIQIRAIIIRKSFNLNMFSFKFSFLAVLAIFFNLTSFSLGEKVYTSYFKPGTNCTVSTGQMDSWGETGYCFPEDNHPESCNGKADTCGVLYACDPTTVTINYWWLNGDMCLRGDAEGTMKYPTGTCLPPSAGYKSFDSDTIFLCKQ